MIKSDKSKFLTKLVEASADGTSLQLCSSIMKTKSSTIDGIQLRTDFTYTNGLITKISTLDKATKLSSTVEYSYDTDKLIQVLSPKIT